MEKEKVYKLSNKEYENQMIDIKLSCKESYITFESELSQIKYSNKYTLESIKQNNQFLFLCSDIKEVFAQLQILLSNSNIKANNYIIDNDKIIISINTNMLKAKNVKIELLKKNEFITPYKSGNNNDINNIELLRKENKELKETINNLVQENIFIKKNLAFLNINFGVLDSYYISKIKSWLNNNNENISFELIYNLNSAQCDRYLYNKVCDTNNPLLFIFI